MVYSCGGSVELTTPVSNLPGWVRQPRGVGVAVGGMGLGVKVAVGGGAVTVTVGGISVGAAQAEGPRRSVIIIVVKIA